MPCAGPIHLRRALIEDAAGIAEVYVAGWQAAHADLVPADYLACVRAKARETSWREELMVGGIGRAPWVASTDERVVGFAIGGLTRDVDEDSRTGEIYQLYVVPDCWGRGIGSNLLRHVTRDLHDHGFEQATFWVVSANAAARAFAAKHGWRADGSTRFEDCGGTQVEQVRYGHALR